MSIHLFLPHSLGVCENLHLPTTKFNYSQIFKSWQSTCIDKSTACSRYSVTKGMGGYFSQYACSHALGKYLGNSVQSTKCDANHNLTISCMLWHWRNASLKRLEWLFACPALSIARHETKNTLGKSFSGSSTTSTTYWLLGFLQSSQHERDLAIYSPALWM